MSVEAIAADNTLSWNLSFLCMFTSINFEYERSVDVPGQ
jgi:hypothetical protein